MKRKIDKFSYNVYAHSLSIKLFIYFIFVFFLSPAKCLHAVKKHLIKKKNTHTQKYELRSHWSSIEMAWCSTRVYESNQSYMGTSISVTAVINIHIFKHYLSEMWLNVANEPKFLTCLDVHGYCSNHTIFDENHFSFWHIPYRWALKVFFDMRKGWNEFSCFSVMNDIMGFLVF